MRFRVVLTTLFAAALCGGSAYADSFTARIGNLGNSSVMDVGSTTVTAYGFAAPSTPTSLYYKNQGGDEVGVGVASSIDREISGTQFVTFDVSNIDSASITLTIGSVETGESYRIWGSNTLGDPGTILVNSGTLNDHALTIPDSGQYKYISVSAPKGDVTVAAIGGGVATSGAADPPAVPEPGAFSMLFTGFLGLAGVVAVSKLRRVRTC